MEKLKRIAVINDLSGASRCSLTVNLPIITALGIQCACMPTAILSNHTGYDEFFFKDFTGGMRKFSKTWQKMNLEFDAIYSGFLGSHKQIETVSAFIDKFKSSSVKIIIDPVMGDNGKIYSTYTKKLCADMKKLAAKADIVTPNITEACVLSGVRYENETPSEARLIEMAEKISELGAKNVIITGNRNKEKVSNFVYSNGTFRIFSSYAVPKYFSGTGDVFSSVIAGLCCLGADVFKSVDFASEFVRKATELSFELGLDVNDGICFEKVIHLLTDIREVLK